MAVFRRLSIKSWMPGQLLDSMLRVAFDAAMTGPGENSSREHWRSSVFIALVAAIVYLGLPSIRNITLPTSHWFAELAGAIRTGHLSIEPPAGQMPFELIPIAESNRFYVAYPPLPAVVLLPIVAIFGKAGTAEAVCRLLCVVAILLFDATLRRAWPRIHGASIATSDRMLFTAGFAFGTALWDSAARAGDWHLAHVCAVVLMLFAVFEFFGKRRAWLMGLAWGAAMLARPTVAFSGLFFLFVIWRKRNIRQLLQLVAGPVCAVLLFSAYNAARFGTPVDFHYDQMTYIGEAQMLMQRFGQFNLSFWPRNFFWFFLAPPTTSASDAFPWIVYDPYGMSVFLTSPFIVYGIIGIFRNGRDRIARPAAIATALCLCVLLAYFNTGFWQFGHRFGLDYLPIWLIAVMVGMGARLSRTARGLIVASIVVHIWGIAICGMDRIARLPDWLAPGV